LTGLPVLLRLRGSADGAGLAMQKLFCEAHHRGCGGILGAEHRLSGHARDEFDPSDLAPGRDQRRDSGAGTEKAASQDEITGRGTFPQEEAEDDNSQAAEDGYNR
jgi:hypothetical protein